MEERFGSFAATIRRALRPNKVFQPTSLALRASAAAEHRR
jgi:hypothetical protein